MFRKVLVTIIALKINLSKILFNKALPSYFLNLIKKKVQTQAAKRITKSY